MQLFNKLDSDPKKFQTGQLVR